MTKNEIILIAEQAHFNSKTWLDIYKDDVTAGDVRGYLEAFAKLVAKKEREACAKVCEELYEEDEWVSIGEASAAIRARGEKA